MTSDDFAQSPEPEGWGVWSKTDELLAISIDRTNRAIYVLEAVNGGKPDMPTPMRRPGVGMSGPEKRAQRRTQAISAAHRTYAIEHDGAYPPPDWDHGVPDDD